MASAIIEVSVTENITELFALYTEQHGMLCENMQRQYLGQSMAYTDIDFQFVADKMRKLREDGKASAEG